MNKQQNSTQNTQSQQNSSSPLVREPQNQSNVNISPKNSIFLSNNQQLQGLQKQSPSQNPQQNKKVQQKQSSNNQPITQQQKKQSSQMNIPGERAPGLSGNLKADIASIRDPDGPRAGSHSAANAETFLFNKHYNKELKLCEDEIPMVLCELNESALAYLNRDQYDNALLLLQKAHGVLDVVDLSGSKRDQYIALQLFHNMAMCYQKQGQLEECALCLETTLDHLGTDYATDQNQSFAMRLYKMKIEVRLRLQFCAILSQLHRHKEAFEQALEGIKIAHLIIRDKISITRLYSKRIDFTEIYGNGNDEQIESINIDKSDNLSQSDANVSKFYSSQQKLKKNNMDDKKKLQQKKGNILKDDQSKSSYPYEEEYKNKDEFEDKLINFQTEQSFLNNLEGSISLVEKTSKKLLPIYKYVLQKLEVIEKKNLLNQLSKEIQNNKENDQNINSTNNEDSSDVEVMINKNKIYQRPVSSMKGQSKSKEKIVKKILNVDLRHILGFLNQTEWIQNLNIGNIMQISPIKFEDLIMIRRNEECLSRDSFLDVISFLIVGYFCASTEIRFIIQLKDEIPKFDNFQIESKTQESELWHTMSLDIACSFLPSDCPLLNHILLSYQKHHAPSQSQILENQILDEKLRVVKPLNGIDNSKFQPIVRVLQNIKIGLPYSKMVPAQKTVSKMIQEINMKFKHSQERSTQLFKQISKNALNTPNGIQSKSPLYSNLQSPQKKLNNYQQMKIKKIDQVVKKFSKEIGLDKNQILRYLLGENRNHNYYDNHNEDFKNGIMNQISNYDSGSINNRFYQNSQFNTGVHASQQNVRPQSQKETLSSRRNQDNHIHNNQTGIAAKIAYNNLGKSATEDANQITNISSIKSSQSQSQISTFQYKNGIGSREWTLSPQAQQNDKSTTSFPVLNSVDNSTNGNQDQDRMIDEEKKIQQQVKSQRIQMNLNINKTEEKQNQFEQKSTSVAVPDQKDNGFFNDINYQKINHEKSYNENHDNGNKFVLNQNDFIHEMDSQQHNLSTNQGGTVRQQSKRVQSKDREKVQRPRSSKGYRGNNIQLPPSQNNINTSHNSSQNNSLVQSGMNQNAASAINIQHQQSQNHLNTQNSIQQATSLNSSSTATGPKFQVNKSEERALKSQQNQRPIINKNQRQKTAGGNIPNSQSSSQIQQNPSQIFGKEMNILQQNLNPSQVVSAKKLVNLTNQLVSQSSSQLPSAQITGNLTKLSKKQIQQIQQLQPLPQFQTNNSQQLNQQNGFGQSSLNSNLANYNSANQQKQNQKQKLNYDELKKLLIKDQQLQNGNLSLLNQQNAQSSVGIAPISLIEQNNIMMAQDQARGRSQNNTKQKKTNQQNQIPQVQNQQNFQKYQNPHSSQSLEKSDQIQVVLDDYLNQNLQKQIVNYQSQIIRESKDMMSVNSDINKVDFSRDSSQSQKEMARNKLLLDQMKMKQGVQQIQQVKKVQGQLSQNQSQPQIQQSLNQNIQMQQSHLTQQQAQQLYLSQIQSNGIIRPSSSQKYIVKSQQPQTQIQQQQIQNQNNQAIQKKVVGQNQQIQREQNNKSALSTIGKHQTVMNNNAGQDQQQQQQHQQQQIIQQQIILNVNNNIQGGIKNISNNGQNQNSSASLKRRDKARIIMHE